MNRLTALGALLAVLIVPTTAAAAPLNELPFQARPDRAFAGCLSATGSPGGLSTLGPYSARESATDLLTVGDRGAAAAGRVSLGRTVMCDTVAEAPGGAAIAAGTAQARTDGVTRPELRVAIREPGGEFGPATRLGAEAVDVSAAVAPSGQAVVAWVGGTARRRTLEVARRAPGGAFGAPETVTTWRSQLYAEHALEVALDTAGTVTVMLSRERGTREGIGGLKRIDVATSAAGAPFTLQALATRLRYNDEPDLAVAPDGWTLIAHLGDRYDEDRRPPKLFERAAGADRFAAVALPDPLPAAGEPGLSFGDPAVAVRSGGGAIVAWRTGPFEARSGVDAFTRESAGAFTARRVARPSRATVYGSGGGLEAFLVDPFSGPPWDAADARLRIALATDGRVLLAWPAPAGGRRLKENVPRAAIGTLGGTFEAAQTLAAPFRQVTGIAPLFLADGRAAVAWTDMAAQPADGRLHVAVEGAAAPARRAAPRLTLSARSFQRLYASQPVIVRAGCDRACDLRTTVVSPHGSSERHLVTRLRGGVRRLNTGTTADILRGRPRMVRVVVHATAPGGGETVERSVRVRVARRPALPAQPPLDIVARRDGGSIVVTWRTAEPARRQLFFVMATRGRTSDPEGLGETAWRDGKGRRRFRVRLRPEEPAALRWVTVIPQGYDGTAGDQAVRRVRIR